MVVLVSTPLIISHFVERYVMPRAQHSLWWVPVQTSAWAAFGMAMFVFYRVSSYDFIYFQF